MIKYIGVLAAILTTTSGLPQVYKIMKTKIVSDLSLLTILMLFIGLVLWLIYGFLINDYPLIFANIFAVLIQGYILCLKLKYDKIC